jgi:hypothetical protein
VQVRIPCFQKHNVFSLENYYASKSSTAIHKAFSKAHPDKEVPNKTTIHQVTNFQDSEMFDCDKCTASEKTAEIIAALISSSP